MMINTVLEYLDDIFPNAKCELEYTKPYELLLAVVMSAQTTDKRVNEVNKVLFKKYGTLSKLADADIKDIEKIIKPIGTYKKKSIFIKEISNRLIKDKREDDLNDRKYLSTLPGVGRKTINVFLSVIYNVPSIPVDTHVERVSKRLNLAKEKDNVLEVEKKLMRKVPKDKWIKFHHQMIFFGRYKCKSRSPECKDCKLKDICKYYERSKK